MATLPQPVTFGVTSGTIGDHTIAPFQNIAQTLLTTDASLVGDASRLTAHAQAGPNTLLLQTTGSGTLVGDALAMSGHAQASSNTLTLTVLGNGEIVGDAVSMGGQTSGGHNTLTLNNGLLPSLVVGDAETMSGHASGGFNVITGLGTRGAITLAGDALTMSGQAQGGHNQLTGNEAQVMYGDAQTISGFAQGGHNTLVDTTTIGEVISGQTTMYGDGQSLLGHASGGFNTLVSGFADDIMWGSAATVSPNATVGPDTFVFSPPNGHDQIMDFRPGVDLIELNGFGFTSFDQLKADFQTTPDGVLIGFDALNSILLHGVTVAQLSPSDFLFG
jgi:hypothetical protein